jgi:GcrA cell cycle regulator
VVAIGPTASRKLSEEQGMRRGSWSPERINLLRKLWGEGQTAAAIAVRLGDMSRSAVLGKVFRLRLDVAISGKVTRKHPSSAVPAPSAGAAQIARRRRSPKRSRQPQPLSNTARRHKTLLELTNTTCR